MTELGRGVEFDLIRRFLEGVASSSDVVVGPGDDAAVLAGGIVVSVDMAVEGVHFRREWLDAREIGVRAAAAALSDLAAMAAAPVAVLAALALPPDDVPDTATAVVAGLREAAADADAVLVGGDVTRSPGPMILDITVLGRADAPVLRSGAHPGDALWVTGALGGAAAAVEALAAGRTPPAEARAAYARPRPRVREARWLAERLPLHAMIDLSDGLAGDVSHLAAAGGVRITVEASRVPVHPGAGGGSGQALDLALAGGEDYELCFAAPEGAVEAVADAFREAFGVSLTRVGRVSEGSGSEVLGPDGAARPAGGFSHFTEVMGKGSER